MTKASIVRKIHAKTGIQSPAVKIIVDEFMKAIKSNMAQGHNIYLRGFGSFYVRCYAAKRVYNINQDTYSLHPERRLPVFKPGKTMLRGVSQKPLPSKD